MTNTKTTQDNVLNVMYNNHRILIDNITEYDYNGDMAVVKKMCTVVSYVYELGVCVCATPMVLNVSPYTGLMDMDIMARTWIDCGCPSNDGCKWTKDSLHAWVTG